MKDKDADLHQIAEIIYREHGKFYTEIVRSMSDRMFDWAFTLNTGALTATTTFMAVAIKWKEFSFNEVLPFLFPIFVFGSGIFAIIFSAYLEHIRFSEKGELLDKHYDERESDQKFINKVPPSTPCYDTWSERFQKWSYYLFFGGFIISIATLLYHAK